MLKHVNHPMTCFADLAIIKTEFDLLVFSPSQNTHIITRAVLVVKFWIGLNLNSSGSGRIRSGLYVFCIG